MSDNDITFSDLSIESNSKPIIMDYNNPKHMKFVNKILSDPDLITERVTIPVNQTQRVYVRHIVSPDSKIPSQTKIEQKNPNLYGQASGKTSRLTSNQYEKAYEIKPRQSPSHYEQTSETKAKQPPSQASETRSRHASSQYRQTEKTSRQIPNQYEKVYDVKPSQYRMASVTRSRQVPSQYENTEIKPKQPTSQNEQAYETRSRYIPTKFDRAMAERLSQQNITIKYTRNVSTQTYLCTCENNQASTCEPRNASRDDETRFAAEKMMLGRNKDANTKIANSTPLVNTSISNLEYARRVTRRLLESNKIKK